MINNHYYWHLQTQVSFVFEERPSRKPFDQAQHTVMWQLIYTLRFKICFHISMSITKCAACTASYSKLASNRLLKTFAFHTHNPCVFHTHNPSPSVGTHITIGLHRLGLVPIHIKGVEAGGCFPVQQSLGAISGIRVQKSGCREEGKQHKPLRINPYKAQFCSLDTQLDQIWACAVLRLLWPLLLVHVLLVVKMVWMILLFRFWFRACSFTVYWVDGLRSDKL